VLSNGRLRSPAIALRNGGEQGADTVGGLLFVSPSEGPR
jgi:hypothetical protein